MRDFLACFIRLNEVGFVDNLTLVYALLEGVIYNHSQILFHFVALLLL